MAEVMTGVVKAFEKEHKTRIKPPEKPLATPLWQRFIGYDGILAQQMRRELTPT